MTTIGIILIAVAVLAALAIITTASRAPHRPENIDRAGPDELGRLARERQDRDAPAQRW